MRIMLVLIVALLFAPIVFAATQEVIVNIHPDGVVEEHITLRLRATEEYDVVEYALTRVPLAVVYNGTYTFEDAENGTTLTLEQPSVTGQTTIVEFTLVYDDMVLDQGRTQVFSVRFDPIETIDLVVALPTGAALADVESPVSPPPNTITTDGRQILLHWESRDTINAIVLYDLPRTRLWMIIVPSVILLVGGAMIPLLWRRRKNHGALLETLTSDELQLIELIKSGVVKQNDLCAKTQFSKSKMSKVVRKLEEKGAVRKQPLHKTNRLELNKSWK